MSNLQEHPEKVITSIDIPTPVLAEPALAPYTAPKTQFYEENSLRKFGNQFINLHDIVAVDFDFSTGKDEDDSPELHPVSITGATIQFRGIEECWEMIAEDAELLFRCLMSNVK